MSKGEHVNLEEHQTTALIVSQSREAWWLVTLQICTLALADLGDSVVPALRERHAAAPMAQQAPAECHQHQESTATGAVRSLGVSATDTWKPHA